MSAKKTKTEAKIKITLVKSPIGYDVRQKRTLHALGLNKISQFTITAKNPAVLGMVEKVKHLVTVEEVNNETA